MVPGTAVGTVEHLS
jgi:hypothetical protein